MPLPLRIALFALAGLAVLLSAAWLILRRPDIPYAALEARYADADSRFIDLPGGLHVHYRDQGPRDAPVLVMVHGFAASLQAWEPWVARLSDRWRIVTLDLPGQGLTRAPNGWPVSVAADAAVVDQLVHALGLPPAVVIGNSMGGAVAIDVALRHPADVRALVLVDAAGWPEAPPPKGDALAKPKRPAPLIFRLLISPLGRAILGQIDTRPMAKSGLRAAYVDPALVTPALVSRYVDLSRAPGHRDLLIRTLAMTEPPFGRADIARIAVPTLVLHGEADVLIPVDNGRSFAAAISGARLVTYPGVGHVPMEQIPDRSAAELKAFLAALSAG